MKYSKILRSARSLANLTLAQTKNIVHDSLRFAAFRWSGLYRRDSRLWVFGSKHGFSGNSSYLFLWVVHHEPEIEAIWMATNRSVADQIKEAGFKAEVIGTPSARRLLRRAGVYIYNSGLFGANNSNGAMLVNLWHGSGLKRIASHNKSNMMHGLHAKGLLNRLRGKVAKIVRADRTIFISTSPAIAKRFSEGFDVPLSNCPVIGTPRLDSTVDEQMRKWSKAFGTYTQFDEARNNNREIYIYMPTFRQGDREFLEEALPNLEYLSDVLRARSAVMFIKLHPKLPPYVQNSRDADADRRILPWPGNMSFYDVIDQIDCLITDYSSVMFDFIAVKSSGLLLYPFDIERYVDERGFYFPYEESVAGHRVNTFPELCDAIAKGRALAEIEPDKLSKVRARVWGGSKRPASPEVAKEIKRRAGLADSASMDECR